MLDDFLGFFIKILEVWSEGEFVVNHDSWVFSGTLGGEDIAFVCEGGVYIGGEAAWEEEDFSFVDVEFDSNGGE